MSNLDSMNFDDLFNPKVNVADTTKKSISEYKPSPEKGKGNVYQSVIRFIPWYKNPSESMIDKWVCWLVDPIDQKGKYIDCPTSVGQPSILHDMYWKLMNSDDARKKEQAKIFSRNKKYYTLIQVIKDKNAPELEGKILIWSFGKKIFDKYNAIVNPVSELEGVNVEPNNPYDLFNGKPLQLTITKVSGYPNYDQSKFLDSSYPLMLVEGEGDNKTMTKINSKTDRQAIVDFLKTNSPDLDKYAYKPWDDDTTQFVHKIINFVNGNTSIPSNTASVVNNNNKDFSGVINEMNSPVESNNVTTISLGDINMDNDLDLDDKGIGEFDDSDINDILSSL